MFLILFMCCFAVLLPTKNSNPVFAESENIKTSAKAMVVMERDSGRILYSNNSQEKLPMASTTKIITAIFAIEKNNDLDKVVEIPIEAVGIEGTSIGLKQGEHLTIRELLYGLMLRSGNDSAVALAIATSGSLEQFVIDVNVFLNEKGIKNTQIKNPHGLHDDEHYTTAEDLAQITAYALKNKYFAEIVGTQKKQISNELKSKFNRRLFNKNRLLKSFDGADGVKTGYTKKAGRCFVGSATRNGMQLICVLLNCNPMFEECEYLLDKAFSEYKKYKLISQGDCFGYVDVEKSKTKKVDLYAESDFEYPLKEDELKNIKLKINKKDKITAPIEKDSVVAEVQITLEKQLIFSDKIYTIKEIKPNTLNSEFQRVIEKM